MKNERWKVHICLVGIIVAAVLIGACYYSIAEGNQQKKEGGILVDTRQGVEHGC